MKKKRILYFALGTSVVVLMGQATGVRNDGIQFPDGSVQTTAASTAEAWPFQCYHAAFLDAGEKLELTCSSPLSGAPPAWGSGFNGVPTGWAFLIHDVAITPIEGGVTTGSLHVSVIHREDCSSSPRGLADREFRLVGYLPAKIFSTEAPMLALGADQCVQVRATVTNTVRAQVKVYGFMTTEPSRLGP